MRALVPVVLATLLPVSAMPAESQRGIAADRDRMVAEDIEARGVRDARVVAAMRRVPRHEFVPQSVRHLAHADSALPIGYGQTISQPYIVAFMTEQAGLNRDAKVLEIGTGSGYQAAVAAELSDHVFSIEIVPQLAERAKAALRSAGYPGVQVRTGNGYHGWPDEAPFDVIIVTAASETVPPPLVAQLKDGGRMLIPIGPQFGAQNLVLVTKRSGRIRTKMLMPVAFVPFTRAAK